MKVSIDISMYPLNEDYCQPIIDFIAAMKTHDKVSVQENSMSTHIYGDYREVMAMVTTEMESVLAKMPETVFVIKLLGIDRNKAKVDRCD